MFIGEVGIAMADTAPALLVAGVGAELVLWANAFFTGTIDDVSASALGHSLERR
jgi:hypothetical protein